ncbi:thioesterase [Caldimonas brevitalea]|uniref:Thioesterase n=2 Tax=Caldimonas brevitalea TaxID=413882 RepID=A0A0G3BNW9_9BURK|nr:alpha/beta fold hydrolase [Caldimonas brevitalea]AKJ29046.1 thioesterase [Caldimonas brevitalea]
MLIAFPFAGGGESSYEALANRLKDSISLVTLSLPGRGPLHDVEPYDEWPSLIDDLIQELVQHTGGAPFALFGHSFGALQAFEVCRALVLRNMPLPLGLFVSSYPAPHLVNPRSLPGRQTHTLPEPEFVAVVREWGFFSTNFNRQHESAQQEALLQYGAAALRADLRLDETYRYSSGAALPIPAVVFGSTGDHSVPPESLAAWQAQLAPESAFSVEHFEGGHFYLQQPAAADALAERVMHHMEQWLRALSPSVLEARPQPGSLLADPSWQVQCWNARHSVLAHVCRQVERLPHNTLALVDGERRWTYRQLSSAAAQLAESLETANVQAGDVVGVFLPHGAEYTLSLLAAWSVRAAVCLLEKNWSDALLKEFVASCKVRLVLTLPTELVRVQALLSPLPCLAVSPLTAPSEATRLTPAPCRGDDVAFVSLTSGSTGKPKAVLTTHRGTSFCFLARQSLYPYQEGEREGVNVFFAWECFRPLMFGLPATMKSPGSPFCWPQRRIQLGGRTCLL